MLAQIKHILIKVKALKIGYIVRIDGLFGMIEELDLDKSKAIVKFTDDSRAEYTFEELLYCVVKFLAIMKDFNSFPVIHGDFFKIIYHFETKEKVKAYVDDKFILNGEGSLTYVLSYPNDGDVVELTSLQKAEEHRLLSNKSDRIGIIERAKDRNRNIFIVKFPSKTINLKRSDFAVLNGIDSKQIFKLDD